MTDIGPLIESLGLPADQLGSFLVAELEEFLEANLHDEKEEELGDMLFSLAALVWAHMGKHYDFDSSIYEKKITSRLRNYGTVSCLEPIYRDKRIAEMKFGVLHIACGRFSETWQEFDVFRNGSVAEIALLTDIEFCRENQFTNHCILTFGNVRQIEYDFLNSNNTMEFGNTIRCRIPDFMFRKAKQKLKMRQFEELLCLQVFAAVNGILFDALPIAHFHSWECGFVGHSPELVRFLATFKTFFSPYLTTGRLKQFVEGTGGEFWTMSIDELALASEYERELSNLSMRTVLESGADRKFFSNWVHADRLEIRSFSQDSSISFNSAPANREKLNFLLGGRPVREKGFLEICRELHAISQWANGRSISVSFSLLCMETQTVKGAEFLDALRDTIDRFGIEEIVRVERKVPIAELYERIACAAAIIVPSLYDPFCLMPTYANAVETPSFISKFAGVSDNIESREFVFNPTKEGDLVRAVKEWYQFGPAFVYESKFPSYKSLYLSNDTSQPWE